MMLYLLTIAGAAVTVVALGTRGNLIMKIVMGIILSMSLGVSAGTIVQGWGMSIRTWEAPLLVIIPLPFLAVYLAWLSDCEPVTVAGVVGAVRQRVAVRATVRRRVQQYQVEVS